MRTRAGKISTRLALLVGQLHCHGGVAAVCRLLDSRINLSNPAIEVSDDTSLHRYPGVNIGTATGNPDIAGQGVTDVPIRVGKKITATTRVSPSGSFTPPRLRP